MSHYSRLLLVPILIAVLVACAPNLNAPLSKNSVQSSKARVTAPQVSAADQAALAAGNEAFALSLYHALGVKDSNVFYSPYSISLALAMTYGGARGETARQMAETLHFTLPQEQLHPAFNALGQELSKRKDTPGNGADGKGFRFNVVNDIWGQQDYTFQPAYLDLLATNYGAGLRLMDFKRDPEAARKTINDYIAQKTEQRIKDLIPQGAIDPQIRLVLTNAIYFNAAWQYPFDKSSTRDAPFNRLDGSTVNVPLMRLPTSEYMPYLAGDGFQAVSLPYEGGQISMLILVPEKGQFESFENGLDAARLNGILSQMQPGSVIVDLPRFKTESSFSLGSVLSGMGMQDAFTPNAADFSGMDGTRQLFISEVVHKAFVKVDEVGTEAAAATAVLMMAAGMPSQPVELVIDRPFIFFIRDDSTNTFLFMGKVIDPSK